MAFDGKYLGTAALAGSTIRSRGDCATVTSVDMTITGGQVVIHEIRFEGYKVVYQGMVNTAGEVSASRQSKVPPYSVVPVSGTVHDKAFTGVAGDQHCYYKLEMSKV